MITDRINDSNLSTYFCFYKHIFLFYKHIFLLYMHILMFLQAHTCISVLQAHIAVFTKYEGAILKYISWCTASIGRQYYEHKSEL